MASIARVMPSVAAHTCIDVPKYGVISLLQHNSATMTAAPSINANDSILTEFNFIHFVFLKKVKNSDYGHYKPMPKEIQTDKII